MARRRFQPFVGGRFSMSRSPSAGSARRPATMAASPPISSAPCSAQALEESGVDLSLVNVSDRPTHARLRHARRRQRALRLLRRALGRAHADRGRPAGPAGDGHRAPFRLVQPRRGALRIGATKRSCSARAAPASSRSTPTSGRRLIKNRDGYVARLDAAGRDGRHRQAERGGSRLDRAGRDLRGLCRTRAEPRRQARHPHPRRRRRQRRVAPRRGFRRRR